MKEGKPLNKYDRSRFYGPFSEGREIGYTDYPYYGQIEKNGIGTEQVTQT